MRRLKHRLHAVSTGFARFCGVGWGVVRGNRENRVCAEIRLGLGWENFDDYFVGSTSSLPVVFIHFHFLLITFHVSMRVVDLGHISSPNSIVRLVSDSIA